MPKERKIKLSIITSVLSKVSTLALQLFAMPLAVKQLGAEGFVVYSMMMGVMGWLMLSSIGVGPAITIIISPLRYKKDRSSWFSSALIIAVFVSLVVFLGALILLALVDVNTIFMSTNVSSTIDVNVSFYCILIIFVLQNFCTVTDAVVLASQKQYITNSFSFLSSIVSVVFVVIYGENIALVSHLLLIILGPIVAFRLINALRLICVEGYVNLNPSLISKPQVKKLLSDGKNFLFAGSVANLILHVLPVLIVGRFYSTDFAAQYAALNQIILLGSGLVSMVCLPLIPAITESVSKGSYTWAIGVYSKLLKYVLSVLFLTIVVGCSYGSAVLSFVFNSEVTFQQSVVVSASFYFSLLMWTNVHVTILSAVGKIKKVAGYLLVKAVAVLVTICIFLWMDIEVNPFYIMVFWTLIIETFTLYSIAKEFFCAKDVVNN
ncbi:lipopolysaccharide biosynthesis protein [Teredinibacter purpureus]|uniref:lipopolysaccharide biosynthesis protein n=1 Tax=Teredinibacter purpureus TaxID=2731756 RepID=UPI0005F784DF|nr:oligosaccharide flippase family protein [Teredinibacter purpureus]